jgi:hypothetical protein
MASALLHPPALILAGVAVVAAVVDAASKGALHSDTGCPNTERIAALLARKELERSLLFHKAVMRSLRLS